MNKNIAKINKLISDKKYSRALSLLKKTNVEATADVFEFKRLELVCLVKLSQHKLAIIKAKEVLANVACKRDEVNVLMVLSQELAKVNRISESIACLAQIITIDDSLNTLNARVKLCNLAKTISDFKTIELYAPKLVSTQAYFIFAQMLLCESAVYHGNKELLIKRLRVLANHYGVLAPLNLAYICHSYCKYNEYALAQSFLAKLENVYKNEAWFVVFLAMTELGLNNNNVAIKLLESISIDMLPPWFEPKELFYKLLGDAYEKVKRYDDAFLNFTCMAKMTKQKNARFRKIDVVAEYNKIELDTIGVQIKNYSDCNNEQNLVFMLGFPRSGTTLLDVNLEQHPDIVTLSETDTILSVIEKLNKLYPKLKYPESLNVVTKTDISTLRDVYFSRLATLVGENVTGKTIVDKMPINTVHLPLIKLLFPTAKFIVNLRHPLDVILSCFQQNFLINNEMAFLITLDDCAKRHQQVFTFLDTVERHFSIDSIVIRYEDLVTDPAGILMNVYKYLGLKSIEYKSHHKFIKEKVIKTPSSNQVAQALYTSSQYKWKNYRGQIASIVPYVTDTMQKYGYTLDD
tara:strand:+ start:22859 stop:24583 length:1725 start_codon:yes stop_codon:yes gene_type:complete